VCVVNYGPDAGKLCTIVDIVDGNKCLIDGPRKLTGVGRQVIPFKRLALTDLVCKIERSARDAEISAAFAVGFLMLLQNALKSFYLTTFSLLFFIVVTLFIRMLISWENGNPHHGQRKLVQKESVLVCPILIDLK